LVKPARSAPVLALATLVYVLWVRPWELRWGATDQEVSLSAPGDELVRDPHLVATRAVTVDASPEEIWPWLLQIGRGRAGWYSYDRLDNQGEPSARVIIPELQRMAVGDVVVMSSRDGEPYGPTVLELDPPRTMVWGDADEPRRFTWAWLLRDAGDGTTRLVSRVRCRFTWRDPVFALVMEFADPVMMRRCLLNIADRAGAVAVERGAGAGATTVG
jgi:hypothetical protein